METITYTLPTAFASVIVNDDWTALSDDDIDIIENFFNSELKENQYLVLADYEQEPELLYTHDASDYGWLTDECYTFELMEV